MSQTKHDMNKKLLFLFIGIVSVYFLSCTKGVVPGGSDNEDAGDEAGNEIVEDDKKDNDNVDGKTLTVKYEADNAIFPNPERGLYTHRGYLKKYAGNKAAENCVSYERYDRQLYYKYKDFYGYVFYIGKKI